MPLYRRGSQGPEVQQIQERLKELAFYIGPIDGDFGGGTESAVKAFQKAHRLKISPGAKDYDPQEVVGGRNENHGAHLIVDGEVGPETWKRLFHKETIPPPAILEKTLAYRCLALTGTFETNSPVPDCFAGLSGDFDGQGISFGVLQWNFGQGSLQPLLVEMNRRHPKLLRDLLHEEYPLFTAFLKATREEQLAWARSIQDPIRHSIFEPWRGLLKTLGKMPEFQEIEVAAADKLYQSAKKLARQYGLWSERAVALMFDILVQNGSISALVRAQILRDFEKIDRADKETAEVERMTIIAHRRAEAANPRWIEDVRARKLCCAQGRGKVHGTEYDLEGQYGIGLREV